MSKKHYVIWKGRKTGVFDSWAEVKTYTEGQNDAQYMGFPSKEEALSAFSSTYTKALTQRNLDKRKGTKSAPSSYKAPSSSSLSPSTAEYQIYTDGACSPNPGASGTGLAVYKKGQLLELWYGYYNEFGTNNTAELNGILAAFEYAQHLTSDSIQILSDSKYGIDCITKWAKGWQAKGWTRGKGEEIKNLETIQKCFNFYQQYKNKVTISHVKGHANIEGNELADRMAVLARMTKTQQATPYTSLDIKAILAMPSG